MPTQVLVMCGACGRPQFATQSKSCVACGATLPDAPTPGTQPPAPSAREKLIAQYEPFLEASVGPGRRLLLSQRHLEWHDHQKPVVCVELANLKAVELTRRPAFEALAFTLVAFLLAALVAWWPARLGLGLVALLGLVACFAQRRLGLVLHRSDGKRTELFWVVGTRRAAATQRMQSIWASVKAELSDLQVATREEG